MRETEVKKVLNDLITNKSFGIPYMPPNFYKLTKDEQKEVITRFRDSTGLERG